MIGNDEQPTQHNSTTKHILEEITSF
jgi:hypothetical protein